MSCVCLYQDVYQNLICAFQSLETSLPCKDKQRFKCKIQVLEQYLQAEIEHMRCIPIAVLEHTVIIKIPRYIFSK